MSRLLAWPLLKLAFVLSLVLAAGCGNACEALASQICRCLPDDGSRAACNGRAKDQEATYPLRAEDLQYCQGLLDRGTCDCKVITTPEGKAACGIAYVPQ
jgi:hypothetical protein